jgi:phosphomannomutase
LIGYELNECGKRPWGQWKVDEIGDGFIKKTITVNPGASLSLQSHEHRSEKWEIIDGIAEVTLNTLVKTYAVGDTVEIPQKAIHRLKNVGVGILMVKETQFGDILDENDIVRYDDEYGRCGEQQVPRRSNVVFMADMDGTLTPARLPMTEKFAKIFEKFIEDHVFYIVSGSDLQKIEEQVPESVRNKVAGIYCSMGNELHIHGNLVYKNDFTPESSLIKKLEEYRKNTVYPHELYPNYIEKRCGMINFTVLGRDCPQNARILYKFWDDEHKERLAVAEELSALYPQYDVSVGGNISVDIVPRGFGKDQVADHLRKEYKTETIIFLGDRTEKGGNDYALAQRLLELGNAQIIAVNGPDDVLKFFEKVS